MLGSWPQLQYSVIVLRGQNNLPVADAFLGLFHSQGTETIRVRFSLGRGKLLDLPMSAEVLANLVQHLSGLRGFSPETVQEGIVEARARGLISEG
jgi:hypothetical protein